MSQPGRRDRISVFAPSRVDLSPGFTDVEPFCTQVPGRIVNVALDLGVEVTVDPGSVDSPSTAFVDRLSGAVARRLRIECPAISLTQPSLPSGSGLGTSGALAVAVAYALSVFAGTSVEPPDLTMLACAAERDTGLTGGTQDQLASVYGGAGLVVRHDGVGSRTPIDVDLDALGARLVLAHRGGSRNSGLIIDKVLEQRSRTGALRTIRAMNQVAEQMAAALACGEGDRLADLVNQSTSLLRALHQDIVEGENYGQLRALGALAAKPCGAGGRGAVWAVLVDAAERMGFVSRIKAAGWSVLAATPSARGARLRTPGPPRPADDDVSWPAR